MFANDCNLCCRRVDLNNYFPFLHGIVRGIRCTFGLTVISAKQHLLYLPMRVAWIVWNIGNVFIMRLQ